MLRFPGPWCALLLGCCFHVCAVDVRSRFLSGAEASAVPTALPPLPLHFLLRSRVLVGPVVMAYLSDAGCCLLLTREDTRA